MMPATRSYSRVLSSTICTIQKTPNLRLYYKATARYLATSFFGGTAMELLLPLLSFAFVSSITPGPNNLMLSASGVVFGFNRTLPHLLGVAAGFTLLLVVCASGIGALLVGLPAAALALKLFGTAYLLYLEI